MTFHQNSSIACDSLAMLGLIAAPFSRTTSHDNAETLDNANNVNKRQEMNHFSRAPAPSDESTDSDYVSFPILPLPGKPSTRNAVLEQQFPPVKNRTMGQTESTTLYAAWALIVSRMTRSNRVVFGVTDLQDQIAKSGGGDADAGVLTMPICINSDGHQTVQDYLAHVKHQQNKVASAVVEGLNKPGSDVGRRLAPSTLLSIQPEKSTLIEGSLCQHLDEQQPTWSENIALILTIHFGTDCTNITASFDSNTTSEWIMRHLCRQLEFVLYQIQASSPLDSISTIIIATPDHVEHIWDWNLAVQAPVERCVHEIIQECAISQPAAPAICAWDGELSHGQLDRLATGLSGQLAGLGVRHGTVVPLCFEKSMWVTVAMLGVLNTGAAFVLFDPSLPEGRLLALSRQVKANVIVSGDMERQLSSRLAPHVVTLDTVASQSLYNQPGCPKSSSSPSDVMYIAFTSGSTGVPKGAVISHRNLASALHYQQDSLRRTPSSRVYDFCSYTFDVSICNVFSTLAAGGCVCVPSEQQRRDSLVESIASLKANAIDLTPSVARLLSPEQVPSIDTIVFGGETLHPKDVARWWGKVNIINLYGPCECTPNSTINTSPKSIEDAAHLGKGLGLLTWVVDADNHHVLLPPGCVGELLLEGPIVGQGYLDDPEKTAAAFIESPLWLLEGSPRHSGRSGRLYKTGDLVRLDKDGSLTFIGRKDSQVKLRGQRIELGEVEHALRACHSVDEAVVIVQHNNNQGARMVAFVTMHDLNPESGKVPLAQDAGMMLQDEIQQTLEQSLPSFMVPETITILNEFPMTMNGKIDRKSLANRQEMEQLKERSTRAHSHTEQQVAQLWANVLHVDLDGIGVNESFLHLGGNSIDAMQVAAEGRKVGIELTVADILRYPILHELAEKVVGQRNAPHQVEFETFALIDGGDYETIVQDISGLCNLNPVLVQDAYPCTPLQEGIMALSLKRPQSYIRQGVFQISASVSLENLKAAWEEVVRRTPILRTRIVQHHELGMLQVVVDEKIDWRYACSLRDYLETDSEELMELGHPLTRYALITDESASFKWLVWTAHHALYDGWSLKLVADALSRAYEGLSIDCGPGMQTFLRYIKDQSNTTAPEYWRRALDHYASTAFPPLPPHVQQPEPNSVIEYIIPRLQNNSLSVTSSILIRAAWAFAVGRLTNSTDVVFGVTVYGRSAPVTGLERLIAPTFATIPVRVQLADGQSVSDYLGLLQRQAIEMIAFEHTGLQNIAKVSPAAQMACLFQTQLIIQHEEGIPLAEALIGKSRGDGLDEGADTCALTLEIFVAPNQLRVSTSFDSKVMEPHAVQTLLELFHHVLNRLDDAAPRQLLSDIKTVVPHNLAQYAIATTKSPVEAEPGIEEYAATQEPNPQPMSETERQMQKVWASVLNIPCHTITLDDNFLKLGGNSIEAMKVVSKALQLRLQVRVVDIFRHPRLRDLASHTSNCANGDASSIRRAHGSDVVEQSFAQEGLWLVHQHDPTLTWDIIPCAWRLRGPLQLQALQTALLALERRHESLRTIFLSKDGVNLQKVMEFADNKQKLVPVVLDGADVLADALQKDQLTPFELQTEAGWRVHIYQLGKDDYALSIVLHHIICDGWSMDILWKELALFYTAASRGHDPLSTVDPLPVQYRDYSVWQRQQYSGHDQPELDYWADQLTASQPAELPCDKARPAALSGQVKTQNVCLQGQLYDLLQQFCKKLEVTPFVVLLAAFRATHFLLTGVADATIGIPNANRGRWQDKDVVGLLVNMQCIRTKIGQETFEAFVRQVQATMLAAFHRQDTPFEMVVSKLGIQRDLSRHPLFQIIMADHSQLAFEKFELEGVETEAIVPTVAAVFDLQLHIYQESGFLRVEVIFSTDLYESGTMENVIQYWHAVLERGLSDPDAAIKSLGT
ncbi:Amino acid adenylation [Beauveria brongniartii RCEF 3172]|uniref:Amino acid adenylation n=1 Tax=Beauveria brongniartii RCEF 3172 TaxID=1081107 RepID=A0A167GKE8_9HYPO|nr:Amino acid adenylation [Beauveria brongniartii RCEF 3172]